MDETMETSQQQQQQQQHPLQSNLPRYSDNYEQRIVDAEQQEHNRVLLTINNTDNSKNNGSVVGKGWWVVTETSSTYSPSGASPSSSSSSTSSISDDASHRRIMIPSPSSGSLPYDEQAYQKKRHHQQGVVVVNRGQQQQQQQAFISDSCTTERSSNGYYPMPIATTTVAPSTSPSAGNIIYAGPRRRIGRPPLATTTTTSHTTTDTSICSSSNNSTTMTSTPESPFKRHRVTALHQHHSQRHYHRYHPSNQHRANHHQHHGHSHNNFELEQQQQQQNNILYIQQQRRRRGKRSSLLSPLPSPHNANASPRRTTNVTAPTSSYGDATASHQNTFPPPPPITTIAWELSCVCFYYFRYGLHILRHKIQTYQKPIQRFARILAYGVGGSLLLALLLLVWLLASYWSDATRICTPPPGYYVSQAQQQLQGNAMRPLVEYYVHGRGIGHYARSVAIVNQLNEAGIDVRLFLSRASHWRALHEDKQQQQLLQQQTHNVTTATLLTDAALQGAGPSSFTSSSGLGTTSAYAVTSLTPAFNFFGALSHTLERIMGDCDVARKSNRYPILVVTDADLPGMLRAKIGGIPSVGIAHGQLFHIAHKPSWIATNPRLSQSWDRQGKLNYYSSYFSNWQIATHFCFLETKVATGVVARAPLRAEIQSMALYRKKQSSRRRSSRRRIATTTTTTSRNSMNSSVIPQVERIRKLLWYGSDYANVSVTEKSKSRRKVVISYFRDHNGQRIQKALLQAGFDVLNFDNGYNKEEYRDPNRYGAKWIVDPKEDLEHRRHRLRIFGGRSSSSSSLSSISARKFAEKLLPRRRHRHHQVDATQSLTSSDQGRRRLAEATANSILSELSSSSDSAEPRLIRVMDRSLFVPLMHVADGVVSSAGSQLMSECIYAGMPLLALYLERDDEQRLNVELSHHGESTCAHHHQIVFGSSLEDLMQSGALLLTSSNATNPTTGSSSSATAKTSLLRSSRQGGSSSLEDARREFVKFLETIRASPISQAYYDELDEEENNQNKSNNGSSDKSKPFKVNSTNGLAATATDKSNETLADQGPNDIGEVTENEGRDEENGEEEEDEDDNLKAAKANMLIAQKGMADGLSKMLPQSDFQGLPDAAAIILEIIKQQIQQQQQQPPNGGASSSTTTS